MAKVNKAFAYLRVSGRGQEDGDGFERQRQAIAKYAAKADTAIVDEFTDVVSGTKELASRDGLAALLDRLESNGVKTVIVERSDRLARDLMVGEVILGQFRKIGVKVIAAEGGNDLTADDGNPTATLIRQVLGAVSQFEKSVIVLKLMASRERVRRTNGRCEGRKPFGTDPKRQGEQVTLERILNMRRAVAGGKRTPVASIAAALNAENIPTRTGAQWKAGTVYGIIKANAPQLTAAI